MADQKDDDSSWWSKLANFAREVHSITDPNVMYSKMYHQHFAHTNDPEKAAELARRGADMVGSSLTRNKAIWQGVGFMNPVTAPAMIVNQIQEAAEAKTPEEAAAAGAMALAPNVYGKSLKVPSMGRPAASAAPTAAPGYADGGDVSRALSTVPQAPEADPVGMAKSVMAQPRPTLTPGQQKLMASFQSENRPAAVVSPKPGTGSTEDSPGWNFATPQIIGADQPPPMQAPTQNEPRMSNLAAHAQKMMKSKGFRDLVRDVAGIHEMEITPTTGSWLGKVEPSFIISGRDAEGNEATHEQIRKLSHLMGLGWQQDAVVEHHHNPDTNEGIPTVYLGKGKKLGKSDLDKIHAASQANGLDFTRTKDGMGVKFSHFGDENDTPEVAHQKYSDFLDKINAVSEQAGLPDKFHVRTAGDLKYAKDYLNEIFGGSSGVEGDSASATRSPDLFRRIVDHVLAPYAKAAASEGYRLSPERLGEAYGLTKDEVDYVRQALLPSAKVDRSTVPLMEDRETLDVRPTGARGEPNVDDVIFALQNRAASSGQIDPNDFSDAAKKNIAASIADEVSYHANNSEKSAIGWYDNALKRAKGEYHKIFPELATDPDKEQLFNSILGITSQGADVHTNSKNAARVYDMVRNGASISDAVDALKGTFGKETRAIEFNLKKYESLLDKLGPQKMQALFNQKMPKKDWEKFIQENDFMVDHNGAPLSLKGGANQKITGWSVFGPKIGSFMNNLNGDYSTLTADLWFTRTWNRLLGHSFLHQPTQEAAQYRDFRDALKAEYYKDTGPLAPLGQRVIPEGKTVQGKLQTAKDTGEAKPWLHGNDAQELSHEDFQRLMDNPDDLLDYAKDIHTRYVKSGYKDKSDLRRRAKNWIENRYNSAAAPRGDKERNFQQDTVEEAQKVLKKKYGLNVSVADIQAALWFHEKELFGKYGVASTRAEPADYYDAAHQTVADHQSGNLFKTLKEDRAASKVAAQKAREEAEDDESGEVPHKSEGGALDGQSVDRLKMSHKDVTQRIPQLTEAAQRLGTDEMTPEMYQELVNKHKPVRPWEYVPEPATHEEIAGAVRENQRAAVGKGHLIPKGHPVGLRLDIPAYKDYGVWAPTIHDKSGPKATVLAHEPVAHISNAEFSVPESKALNVAKGTNKSPFATIDGNWEATDPEEIRAMAEEYLNHPEWSQVGMDPERHSYFYDRRTQEPVTHADEVVQVGPLVLAKNARTEKPKESFAFADGGDVEGRIPYDDPQYAKNLKKFHGKTPDAIKGTKWYHGTDKNFQSFMTNRAGHIFVTPDTDFANRYARSSWSHDDLQNVYESAKRNKIPEPQPNVVPVHVRAEKPFDYENPRHLNALIQELGPDLIMDPQLWKFVQEVRDGHWGAIESSPIQNAIKALGHDSFFVKEDGVKNLGLYDPSQIKSATGNNGNFDPSKEDITKAEGGEIIKPAYRPKPQRRPDSSVVDKALMLLSRKA